MQALKTNLSGADNFSSIEGAVQTVEMGFKLGMYLFLKTNWSFYLNA